MANSHAPRPASSVTWVAVAYVLMIGATVMLFLVIRSAGGALHAPAPLGSVSFGSVTGRQQVDVLLHVLVALATVVLVARLLGALFRHVGQPPVIGEVVAGILLGPSLLGRVAPGVVGLPVAADRGAVPQRPRAGRRHPLHVPRRPRARPGDAPPSAPTPPSPSRTRASSRPFLLGAALALWLYPRLSTQRRALHGLRALHGRLDVGDRVPGARAHPHRPRHARKTRSASSRSTCAAVDDVTAWCLLAFVVEHRARRRSSGAFHVGADGRPTSASSCSIVRPVVGAAGAVGRHAGAARPSASIAVVFVAPAALGAGHRVHRHPRDLRRVPRSARSSRTTVCSRASCTNRLEDLVVVLLLPGVLRLHRACARRSGW